MSTQLRTAIVTGASKGIGAAIASRLATDGFQTVVNYASSEGEAHELVASIKAAGGRAWAIRADVADASAVKELFDRAERECGQVDVLVNSAGILKLSTIAAFRDEDYASITVKKSDWCGSDQAANACASVNCNRIARN